MTLSRALGGLIDRTPWIDTHEHLIEERHRLPEAGYQYRDSTLGDVRIPGDWTALIRSYAMDDLVSAGLAPADASEVIWSNREPTEKWDIIAPFVGAVRHAGYWRAVDLTTERLFGLRLSRETCEEIDDRARRLRQPGYYRHVLHDVANVERCQVDSVDADPICISDDPELLDQDLSILTLALARLDDAERMTGMEAATLDDYADLIDACFARYAEHAIAVKCQWAYQRPLAVQAPDAPPHRAFERLRAGAATPDEVRLVQDFAFRRCLDRATDYELPVKLHLGYLGGTSRPEIALLRDHVHDMAALVQSYPTTTFVLMHMAWPHQEELMALAKHSPNVVVDLCWAWIVSPLATREFLQRFLLCAPANKLLCFGGDYMTVESVVGHAEIARRGLQSALESLVSDGWLTADAALDLVPTLMRGNAERALPRRPAPTR